MILALKSVDAPARPELMGLLHAARQDAGDVCCRLVLADWLEENGDESDSARAELIRIQCRLEPQPLFAAPRDPFVIPARSGAAAALLRRQDQLLTRHGTTWLGPLASLVRGWDCRRGMMHLEMDARALLTRQAVQLARSEAWAWVESIRLHPMATRQLGQLASCPPLPSVPAIKLMGNVSRSDLRSLSRMRWFSGLRELDLSQVSLPASCG
jgi:uncharacterized protein (TIGR02996 family)